MNETELVDKLASEVHRAWVTHKVTQGLASRKADDGEEQMVPFEKLSERAKNADRVTVKATLDALEKLGLYFVPESLEPLLRASVAAEVGKKADNGKERYDLLPFKAVTMAVRVLTFGAKKYSPDNWRHVPDYKDRYLAAALRHIVAWRGGEKLDPESGEPHLAHALCCVLFLAELEDK